jgi:hypothetical protein
MPLPDSAPDLFSFELLDTRQCREFSRLINDFENSFFGPDFFCQHEWIQPWIDSGCLFSAALFGEVAPQRKQILAAASIFITHDASRDALLQGGIADYQLDPWSAGPPDSDPVFYASSMVCHVREYRFILYKSLLADLALHIKENGLCVRSGFAIASCEAGRRHLLKIGFTPLRSRKYLHKYDFMAVEATTAQNAFWQVLLRLGENAGPILNRRVFAPAGFLPAALHDDLELRLGTVQARD